MNCYLYTIKNAETVIRTGYLHATNSVAAEKRILKEILPSVDNYSSIAFSQAYCEKCNSDHDVTNFVFNNKQLVLCQECRVKFIQSIKRS